MVLTPESVRLTTFTASVREPSVKSPDVPPAVHPATIRFGHHTINDKTEVPPAVAEVATFEVCHSKTQMLLSTPPLQ